MDERYEQIKNLFLTVCNLSPTKRASRLDRECGRDGDLRAEVEALLAHHDAPTATIDDSAVKVSSERSDSGPTRIGQYRVIREIGRGGMGVVYLGIREDDRFKHRAAIKVLRRGMDTDVLRRFKLERQLLAALSHPGIARLYDGGETPEGGGWG